MWLVEGGEGRKMMEIIMKRLRVPGNAVGEEECERKHEGKEKRR